MENFKVVVRSYYQYWDGELDLCEEYEKTFASEKEAKKVMYEVIKEIGVEGMWLEARINNTTYEWCEIR